MQLGVEATDAVPALIAALSDPEEYVRWEAAAALGIIGPGAKDAVPELTKALADKNFSVRRNAAEALGNIGPAARSAFAALQKATNDSDATVQDAAAEAVNQLGPVGEDAVGTGFELRVARPKRQRRAWWARDAAATPFTTFRGCHTQMPGFADSSDVKHPFHLQSPVTAFYGVGDMAKSSSASELVPLDGSFSIPLKSLPCLQVFGLPLDSEGDTKVQITFSFPAAKGGVPLPNTAKEIVAW